MDDIRPGHGSGVLIMNQADIKQHVTDLIIKQLEAGEVPWRKGWSSAGGVPTSLQTNRPYQGVNALILSIVGMDYSRPLWVTYNNARKLGGHVRKGEKGTAVVYGKKITKQEQLENGETVTGSFFLYKADIVFNVDQCDGIELPARYVIDENREPVDVMPAMAQLWDGYQNRPELFYSEQGRAFYSPSADSITLPTLKQFNSEKEHAYTLAHEMIHSTGHQSRLDRWKNADEKPSGFGCESYAKEELVAELGACMMLSSVGIEFDLKNSGAYIKNWLGALRDDTSLILKASSKAQAAANHILGIKVEEEVAA